MIPKHLEGTDIGKFATAYLNNLHELNLTPRQYNYIAEMLLRVFTDFHNVNDEIERISNRILNFLILYNHHEHKEELLMTLLAASVSVLDRPPLQALNLDKQDRDTFRQAFRIAREELLQRLSKNSESLARCLDSHYPPLPESPKEFSLN